MLEFEKKILLTKQEYDSLMEMQHNIKPAEVQINHYYDSDTFEMNRHGITCRIREKNGKYTATFKAHQSAESECSIEHSKEVTGPWDDRLFKDMNVKWQGSLTTLRTVIYKEYGLEIVLDENTYLGFTDYELEIEYLPEYAECVGYMIRNLARTLDYKDTFEFCRREKWSKSKSARFFERMQFLREKRKEDSYGRLQNSFRAT